jgi:hypothetical protein
MALSELDVLKKKQASQSANCVHREPAACIW